MDSISSAPAAVAGVPASGDHGLSRSLLVPCGSVASASAAHAVDLLQSWLGTAPPVAVVDAAGGLSGASSEWEPASVMATLDQLAGDRLVRDLRASGYTLLSPDELQGWLVIAQDDDAGQAWGQVGLGDRVQRLDQLVWQRLRLSTSWHALILAEPAEEAKLAEVHQELRAAGVDAVYVAGPITQGHVRLPAAEWQERAVTALALMLCATLPSHLRFDHEATQAITVGAMAWQAPRATLQQWLRLRSASQVVARLSSGMKAGVAQAAEPTGAVSARLPRSQAKVDPAQVAIGRLSQELAGVVASPGAHNSLWRDLHVTYEDVPVLAERLCADAERNAHEHQTKARRQRLDWLDKAMAGWAAEVDEKDRLLLPAEDGWPRLAAYADTLRRDQRCLQGQMEAVDAALTGAGQRVASAERSLQQALADLAALTCTLPAPTLGGLLRAAAQPWRWPGWFYAAAVRLPRQGQQVLDRQAEQRKALWHEANWHVLRQLVLGMQQDVRQRSDWLARLKPQCVAVGEQLSARLLELGSGLPAPWSPAHLEGLWVSQCGVSLDADVALLLQRCPMVDWPSLTVDEVTERLAQVSDSRLQPMNAWSGADFLVYPFISAARPQTTWMAGDGAHATCLDDSSVSPACQAWLEHFVHAAAPLWPPSQLTPAARDLGWWLARRPVPGMANTSTAQEQLTGWAHAEAGLEPATTPADGLAVLCWSCVEFMTE